MDIDFYTNMHTTVMSLSCVDWFQVVLKKQKKNILRNKYFFRIISYDSFVIGIYFTQVYEVLNKF